MIAPRLDGRQTIQAKVGSPRLSRAATLTAVELPLLSMSTGLTDSTSVVAMTVVIAIAAKPDRKDLIRGDISLLMIVLLGLCFDPGAILFERAPAFCHQPDTSAKLT